MSVGVMEDYKLLRDCVNMIFFPDYTNFFFLPISPLGTPVRANHLLQLEQDSNIQRSADRSSVSFWCTSLNHLIHLNQQPSGVRAPAS